MAHITPRTPFQMFRFGCFAVLMLASLAQAAALGTIDAKIGNSANTVSKHLRLTAELGGLPIVLLDKPVDIGPISVYVAPASAVGAGVDIVNLATPVNATESHLIGWGADLATFVDAPTPGYHPYTVTPPSDGPLSLTTPWIYPAGFDTQRSDDLISLFAQNELAALGNSDTAIAFQLAIYEILSEPGAGYDLLSGGFLVVGSDAHVVEANQLLAGLATAPNTADLYFLRNINEKDIIISESVAAVPEPITLASLGMCILGVGGYLKRRNKA